MIPDLLIKYLIPGQNRCLDECSGLSQGRSKGIGFRVPLVAVSGIIRQVAFHLPINPDK